MLKQVASDGYRIHLGQLFFQNELRKSFAINLPNPKKWNKSSFTENLFPFYNNDLNILVIIKTL